MNFKIENNGKNGRILALENGKEIGEMTFVWSGKSIIVDRTCVESQFQGRGVATKLFEELIKFVKKEKITVISVCSFTVNQFKKREDLKSLLA